MIAQRKGCIIYISSVGGTTGAPYHVHYSAAKSGLVGLTKALANGVPQHEIGVNGVAPDLIETSMGRHSQDFCVRVMADFSGFKPTLVKRDSRRTSHRLMLT